jgi:N-methylhydantoinase B
MSSDQTQVIKETRAKSANVRALRDLSGIEFQKIYDSDRFTAAIIVSRFHYIMDHVCAQLLTNAFSPIIRDANDFSATLSAGPNLDYATPAAAKTLPIFYGSMRDAVANCFDEYGVRAVKPGDLLICNDPYRVGTHVNDVCFMRPVFHSGEFITVLTIQAHMMDIGGTVPGGFSGMKRDVYENGLVIPPTLLYCGDRPVRSTFALILDNARYGNFLLPDMQTIHSALSFGEKLVLETVERYGIDAYRGAIRYACDGSAERMSRALEEVPDGIYEGFDDIDCDGLDPEVRYRVCVKIAKCGGRAEVDFSGTSRQAASSINAAWPDIKSTVAIALKMLLDPATPFTSATLRDVDVVLPSGTIASAEPPDGAVMCYWEPLSSGIAAILRALSIPLGPSAVAGDTRAYLHDAVGRKSNGEPFVTTIVPTGGWGANRAGDADSGQLSYFMNYIDPPVESVEASAPVYILRKEYLIDSAGPGMHRGGTGILKDSYWPTAVDHHVCTTKVKTTSGFGVYDGGDGGMSGIWLWRDYPLTGESSRLPVSGAIYRNSTVVAGLVDSATKAPDPEGKFFHWGSSRSWTASGGALVRFINCGGGGWGDAFEREPKSILDDVRDGYVSIEGAAQDYGVIITGDVDHDPEGLRIDDEATRSRRIRGRPARQSADDKTGDRVAASVRVEREPQSGRCPNCGKSALAQYPVIGESGWCQVIKCQSCLTSVSRTRWNRLGYLHFLEDSLQEVAE